MLDSDNAALRAVAEEKRAEYEAVWAKLTAMKVVDNIYTTQTPTTLAQYRDQLDQAIQARYSHLLISFFMLCVLHCHFT